MIDLYFQQFARQERDLMSPDFEVFTTSRLHAFWETIIASEGNQAPIPFWSVIWPGARALARFIMDHPEDFKGKRVLDAACGSGLAGIAAARCGSRVHGVDLSPEAVVLAARMAALNGEECRWEAADAFGFSATQYDIILAGDVFYDRALAGKATAYLSGAAQRGVRVLAADPQRNYCPREAFQVLARMRVPVDPDIEGTEFRDTALLTIAQS